MIVILLIAWVVVAIPVAILFGRMCADPLPQSTVPTDVPAVTHSGQPPAPGVADSTTP